MDFDKYKECFRELTVCEYKDSYQFINWDQPLVFSDAIKFRIIKINISHDGEHTIGIS